MMPLLHIADLIAELLDTDEVTAGCIDSSKLRTVGVYQRGEVSKRECIGGLSSYELLPLRMLVHWSLSPAEAEKTAYELTDILSGLRGMELPSYTILFALNTAARCIGKDEKGICEYVVDADIYYAEREHNNG